MVDHVVLRVFVGPDGRGGNPLGVVTDGAQVPDADERQRLAAQLGYSETLFVDDASRGAVDIYTPSARLPFAGHPLVGISWLLRERGQGTEVLRPPAGDVRTWADGDITWIRGRAEWASGRRTRQYASAAEVDALPAPPPGEGWLYAWAWLDEAAGRVRARAFPRRGDNIVEDEATGAAAVILTAELGRPLDIRQGAASQLLTRPHGTGWIEVGGRTAFA
ncbi:PhzF family phenazine biosynthesis protein [Streptantibioticus rubrisoli]|uniref:PhzF family phenazine biosynthesis protein n=1 Tax=Streptantibioticus rubrisoli TaxID=1387313 RepID=A0ABT1PAA5_9ACTN|nr:PhzF family phenazine biosynthesis protein [Streptantibioticus rubrisoli]MCQ4041265.1 PhzF family phenazine biosynthesis protein [Streptantibioticus rubrisoli]